MMSQSERLGVISAMLADAISKAGDGNGSVYPSADDVLGWLEQQSPNFAAKLAAQPRRVSSVRSGIERALRAHRHWRRERQPCALADRLRPAARQILAGLR